MAFVILRIEFTDFILALTTFIAAKWRVEPIAPPIPKNEFPIPTLLPSISGNDKNDLDFFPGRFPERSTRIYPNHRVLFSNA